MQKKLLPVMSILMIAAFVLAACAAPAAPATEAPVEPAAPAEAATEVPPAAPATGEVYYLNFKPEVAETYAKIADAYKAETGNTLKVVTAAAGYI